MKKVIFLYGIVVLILVVLALTQAGRLSSIFNFDLKGSNSTVTISDQTYKVTVVDTDATRTQGLSGKKSLKEDEGMLFVFQQKGKYPFWMKDMNFPIDIIFINDDTITDITKNAEPNDSANRPQYTPSVDINYVLEVNAGDTDKKNIKVGDKVIIKR